VRSWVTGCGEVGLEEYGNMLQVCTKHVKKKLQGINVEHHNVYLKATHFGK
jgi:hypothetical protein